MQPKHRDPITIHATEAEPVAEGGELCSGRGTSPKAAIGSVAYIRG